MYTINTRINIIRKDYNLTQVEFAKRIGVTNAHISKIEKGKTVPSDALVKLICKEFEINEFWLKNGEEPKYIYELEELTELNLLGATSKFNNLLQSNNPLIRSRASQLDIIFSEIIDIGFVEHEKKLEYLKLVEIILNNINNMVKSFHKISNGNQISFEENQLEEIYNLKVNDIDESLRNILIFFKNSN
ncbi:MAG: helix-turn-helix transcriptional regulator [Tepidibacter sp.]|jgi:transcriptional regulator with XRE-family HTH domain|uniref:helix-turn-helix domain-containing protein n=1 Tax=Tepidibacter sp. TaxID=2529387 RepID=UPI0025DE172B|nr:helix-turn-helix transcriptional regulator [Tepidibacter sp.]MCT4509916.1 helix-turn-helix transcriptional regulator [Tepidibacter sp.]